MNVADRRWYTRMSCVRIRIRFPMTNITYRIEEEREADARRDPIKKLNQYLISNRIVSRAQLEQLEAEVDQEINEAADQALAVGQPSKATAQLYVYSPDIDPTSATV